ncbi:uncharacterized protein LOC132902721 [Amyelois transitella]|uniref:uncharacterized protein LOC132902721 n=1 Tax=Amyelois transitella TaxID=680683 RepID=UPI00298FDDD5|nr:uncharacterized protein LOC132902721 [Amyelois transitella]
MKNGKSPGSDNIPVEIVKVGRHRVIELLRIAFNKCLEEQTIPEIWNCAIVILLHKKEGTGEKAGSDHVRKTNEWLRHQSKVTDVIKRVARLKWEWVGHMARKTDTWSKRLLEWRPWGEKRPRGRPQMRWDDDIRQIAGTRWLQVAQSRDEWRSLKEAYTQVVETG